jgi:hypothetical protein
MDSTAIKREFEKLHAKAAELRAYAEQGIISHEEAKRLTQMLGEPREVLVLKLAEAEKLETATTDMQNVRL